MTRQTFTIVLSVWLCCIILFAGCGGGGRAKPKDMPPLYQGTLTFVQDGVPLDEASIILHSDSKWSVGGKTNEKGALKLTTNGYYDGAPEGTYKITVRKIVAVVNEATGTVTKKTDVIENQFKRENTTPLEVEIGKKDNNQTIEVGKAVSVNVPVTD